MNIEWLEKKLSWVKKIKKFLKKRNQRTSNNNNRILRSRKVFAQQIASTIKLNTQISKKDSFILGISGKWGEGKSTLLDDLENELTPEYKVVKINPWGVGTDQPTFLRNFISELNKQLESENIIIRFWHTLTRKRQLDAMYFDISATKISMLYTFLFIVVICVGVLLYTSFSPYFSFDLPSQNDKTFLGRLVAVIIIVSAVVTPILLGIINNLFTTQSSSKAIATIDGFKEILKKILKSVKKQRIVIFVDDLDRVTPEMARIVLDNLRVFFDEPQLSFVVTGDHSVLERYLGMQTLPNKLESEQLEEGRRYLKKIFNVYWRMPLVIKTELRNFIAHQLTARKTELDLIFNDTQLNVLKSYLEKYFESNFRQIIRFMDTILFTFSLIKTQIDQASEDEKAYFEEMTREPLLVVRILMIQELCSPLFESIIRDNEALFKIEYAVDKKDLTGMNSIIEKLNLTTSQTVFINSFIQEEPRFFNNNDLRVMSLSPFLNLAADSSFGDARGSSPEDFINKVQGGDTNQVKNTIIGSGKEKISGYTGAFIQLVNGTTDPQQKTNFLRTLLGALRVIPLEHVSQELFLLKLKELDLSLYTTGTGQPHKISTYESIWKWLDLQKPEAVGEDYTNKFTYTNTNDYTFPEPTKLGWFSTKILCLWLKTNFTQDRLNAITQMNNLLPNLPKEFVDKEMEPQVDDWINAIISEGNTAHKDTMTNALLAYTQSGKEELQERILQESTHLNIDLWNWVDNRINVDSTFLDRKQLEKRVVDYLDAVAPSQVLLDAINFAAGRVNNLQNEFWEKVLEKHLADFIGYIPTFIGQSLAPDFAPPIKVGTKLFKALLKDAMETFEETRKTNIIDYLKKRWIWNNLLELPEVDKIKKWHEESAEPVKENLRQLLENWGQIPEGNA